MRTELQLHTARPDVGGVKIWEIFTTSGHNDLHVGIKLCDASVSLMAVIII